MKTLTTNWAKIFQSNFCLVLLSGCLLKWHSFVSVRVLMSFLGCSNAALTLIWVPVTKEQVWISLKYKLQGSQQFIISLSLYSFIQDQRKIDLLTTNNFTISSFLIPHHSSICFVFKPTLPSLLACHHCTRLTFYLSSKMAPGPCHLCPLSLHLMVCRRSL